MTRGVETPSYNSLPLGTRWPLRGRAFAEIGASYAVLAVVGLLLGWLLLDVFGGSALIEWETDWAVWWESVRTTFWNTWTRPISALSDTITIVIGLAILVPALAWGLKRWKEPLTLAVALVLEATTFLTVSVITGRDRPPVEQLDASPPTASFPSGHTGAAYAFYFGLALIAAWNIENRLVRVAILTLGLLIPTAVGISRLYRGMHFLTDVVVGAALGLVCVLLAVVIVDRAIERRKAELGRP